MLMLLYALFRWGKFEDFVTNLKFEKRFMKVSLMIYTKMKAR